RPVASRFRELAPQEGSLLLCAYLYCTRPLAAAISPLSLHDALPIFESTSAMADGTRLATPRGPGRQNTPRPDTRDGVYFVGLAPDRKSTRLNSSHRTRSYAVCCLQKKRLAGSERIPLVLLRQESKRA